MSSAPSYAARFLLRGMTPSNATPPTTTIDQGEGSGTAATASPKGPPSTVMKLGLIAAPVVALLH